MRVCGKNVFKELEKNQIKKIYLLSLFAKYSSHRMIGAKNDFSKCVAIVGIGFHNLNFLPNKAYKGV